MRSLTNLGQRAKVMTVQHQILVALFLRRVDGPHHNCLTRPFQKPMRVNTPTTARTITSNIVIYPFVNLRLSLPRLKSAEWLPARKAVVIDKKGFAPFVLHDRKAHPWNVRPMEELPTLPLGCLMVSF